MKIILDIETNTTHDKIWCVVTRDLDTDLVQTWTAEHPSLQGYINKADEIIMHNGISFDAPVLKAVWGITIKVKQVKDTLIMSRLHNPNIEEGHSLAAWGTRLGFPKGDFKDFDGGLTDEMIAYCVQDTLVTAKLYNHLTEALKKDNFKDTAIQLEHEVQVIIAEQERNGFKLDTPYAQALLCEIKTEMSNIEEELQRVFPAITTERYSEKTGKRLTDKVEVFNVGSRQQIAKRLIEKGWKPTKHTEKGQVIIDDDILQALTIPEAKPIGRYLMLQKRASQIESWLEHLGKDGRIHGKVITMGAVTGRCTHSSPNLAQIPAVRAEYGKECRSCFTVDSGNVLVGCDLSGIELRCFAHYLNDEDYINEVVNGDVHTRNQKAFGVSTRDLAKTVLYATLYGASPAKIGATIGSSASEGKRIIDSFSEAVPAYSRLKSKVERFAEKGILPGLYGYQIRIRSAHSSLNTLLQSAGAIIAKQWLVQIKKNLKARKIPYKQVVFCHDEVQIEVAQEYGETVGKICVESAVEAGKIVGFRCPVGAEYKVGINWYETH